MSDNSTEVTPPPTGAPRPNILGGQPAKAPAPEPEPVPSNSIVGSPELEDLIPMARSSIWIVPEYTYYTFSSMREFATFLHAVAPQICNSKGEVCDAVNHEMLTLTKAQQNSLGGCGCNRTKRLKFAEDSYAGVIKTISKTPEACTNIKRLLNNVERVHFWKAGQKVSNQAKIFTLSNSPKFDWRTNPPESPFLII